MDTNKRDCAETGSPLEFCLPKPEFCVQFFTPLLDYFIPRYGRFPVSEATIINEQSSYIACPPGLGVVNYSFGINRSTLKLIFKTCIPVVI